MVRVIVKGITSLLIGNSSKYIIARKYTENSNTFYEELKKGSNLATIKKSAKTFELLGSKQIVLIKVKGNTHEEEVLVEKS